MMCNICRDFGHDVPDVQKCSVYHYARTKGACECVEQRGAPVGEKSFQKMIAGQPNKLRQRLAK